MSITQRLAGHWFESDICVRPMDDGGPREGQRCGRCLTDLSWVTRANVTETGIAHVGTATLTECGELEDYFKTQRTAIEGATHAVATGAGHGR